MPLPYFKLPRHHCLEEVGFLETKGPRAGALVGGCTDGHNRIPYDRKMGYWGDGTTSIMGCWVDFGYWAEYA